MSVLSTVVFVDLSGSTSLYETLGNERATQTVTQLTQWLAEKIRAHGGRVIKKLGDGVLGVFGDASQAVHALATLQRQHDERMQRWPAPLQMGLRAGVATGELVEVDGDCYGDAVNVASRLCERGGIAEIWATESTILLAANTPDVGFRKLGKMEIRGKAEPLVLYQIEWRENVAPEQLTMQAHLMSQFVSLEAVLGQIHFSAPGIERTFQATQTPVHIGRATHTHVRVNDPRVSRLHARVDWRNTGFVFTDLSSFGSWVQFDGSETPVSLRRDACILHGSGTMSLGVPFTDPAAPALRFVVQGGVATPG